MDAPKAVLTTDEAAEYLGLAKNTLEHWRRAGRGPAYFRAGSRVRYRVRDLEDFAERNLELGRATG